MATNTTNLGLSKPSINDNVADTIPSLASNFQKIDDKISLVDSQLVDIVINVKTFGAKGNGINDDTLAIQTAIDSLPSGATLLIPDNGFFIVSQQGTNKYCLNITKPIYVTGNGKIIVKSTVPNDVDVIRYSPTDSNALGGGFSNFSILPETGSPARYPIHLDVTDPNKHIARHTIRNIHVEGFVNSSIKLTNPTGNDGYFLSSIVDCYLGGGILLERAGDSIQVLKNKIFGSTRGIEISAVTGAACIAIEDNNITTSKGAIKLTNCVQTKIVRNQLEQTVVYNGVVGQDGMIYMSGCSNCDIESNNLNAYGTNIKHNIMIDGGRSNKIKRNYLTKGVNECINLMSGGTKHDITYDNTFASGVTFISPSILDNGTETIGVKKTPVLQNGWVDWNVSFETYFYKDSDGIVHINGTLKNGTVTDGTVIFNLPVGYRPDENFRIGVVCYNGATGLLEPGEVVLTPTGDFMASIVRAGRLNITGISFKAV
jgi:hypothetical protein